MRTSGLSVEVKFALEVKYCMERIQPPLSIIVYVPLSV